MFRKLSEHAGTESMERTDTNSQPAQQTFDAFLHLTSGLVGECQRQNMFWCHAALQQSGDSVRNDSRLPGTGPGKDHQWPFKVLHRFAL
jgi:hypothetical protein